MLAQNLFRTVSTLSKRLTMGLFVLALLVQASVPTGYMPNAQQAGNGWSFVICLTPTSPNTGLAMTDADAERQEALDYLYGLMDEPEIEQPVDPCPFGVMQWVAYESAPYQPLYVTLFLSEKLPPAPEEAPQSIAYSEVHTRGPPA